MEGTWEQFSHKLEGLAASQGTHRFKDLLANYLIPTHILLHRNGTGFWNLAISLFYSYKWYFHVLIGGSSNIMTDLFA